MARLGRSRPAKSYVFIGIAQKPHVNAGSFNLAPLKFSGSGFTTYGSFSLAPLKFGGSGSETIKGTGSFSLAPIKFTGGQSPYSVVPTIPIEPAGVIATSLDHNEWSNGCSFLLGSAQSRCPVFLLMASATQGLTTSFAAVSFSNTAAIFKDNNIGWAGANPTRYTIETAGYYTIEWSVSAASGCGNLECYAQVTTSAANPYNPSTTFQFQHTNRAATTATCIASSGGLTPIYLAPGDYIEVYAKVGTAESTVSTNYPQLTGQWVSA